MACVMKDDGKFKPQIFSEKTLFAKLVRSPTRWWDWCMSENEKKGIELIFIDKN